MYRLEEGMEIVEVLQGHWLSLLMGAYLVGMALYGHYRGFLRLTVSMAALLLSLGAVRMAMPPLTAFLKENTGIQQWMQESLEEAIGLERITGNMNLPAQQRAAIEEMPLPKSVKQILVENNNEEIYRILGVDGFIDYIASFLAGRIINALAFKPMSEPYRTASCSLRAESDCGRCTWCDDGTVLFLGCLPCVKYICQYGLGKLYFKQHRANTVDCLALP